MKEPVYKALFLYAIISYFLISDFRTRIPMIQDCFPELQAASGPDPAGEDKKNRTNFREHLFYFYRYVTIRQTEYLRQKGWNRNLRFL